MRSTIAALSLAALAACTQPQDAKQETTPAAAEETSAAPAPPASEPAAAGPYANAWNSSEFSTFRHVLDGPSGGRHTIELRAQTNSPGGETVRVYRQTPAGERGASILFVIATVRGSSETAPLDFPETDPSVPVIVVVENASNRTFAGSYTISILP